MWISLLKKQQYLKKKKILLLNDDVEAFKKYIYLFILSLAVLGLLCYTGAFSTGGEWGLFSFGAWALEYRLL